MHVSLAIADAGHSGMVRLPAMPQQWQQLAVVVANGVERLALGVGDTLNHAGAVVVALQPYGVIALDQRTVGRAPVGARAYVAQQMERKPPSG